MQSPFSYSLQFARTAVCLVAFGVMAQLLGLFAVPVARIRFRDALSRELWMQRAVHRTAQVYMALVAKIGVLQSVGHGVEALRQPGGQLVVANHPSLIDIVALVAFMPQADLVVSVKRANNPFLRPLIRSCGHICNDGGPKIVAECVERIRAGRSVIIFPEGTRSPKRGLHPLRRGAAHIALRAPTDLLPVVINCDPPMLGKDQKWYDLPDRKARLTLVVQEPIATESLLREEVAAPVAARSLTSQLEESFTKGLDIVGAGNA
jgi:1-acyl-sn-glycerol-3-phosphate acyltransferase